MYKPIKRVFDVFGACILLIIFSPIIVITTILIRASSRGSALFKNQRVGKDGKEFTHYKFRSMIVNAHEIMKTDPKFKKLYDKYKKGSFKSPEGDPRVTKIGWFIRRHSIDEIPQLLNVLKGQMSIVGPRPYLREELDEQQKKYPGTEKLVKEALKVKPGITGFWQVSGRSEINFDKRIEMDAYYARKNSLLFDILILLKTPWVMISGSGAI
ncbi:sugar transferase [Patescibacteria group bacterium]